MATTTSRAISSHDGLERKPTIVDQGVEQKAAHKNPSRASAADRDILPDDGDPVAPVFVPEPASFADTGDPDSVANWANRKGVAS